MPVAVEDGNERGAASPVAELTGTDGGQRARVIVLDPSGNVAWFDDEGYSARKALELARLVRELRGAGAGGGVGGNASAAEVSAPFGDRVFPTVVGPSPE